MPASQGSPGSSASAKRAHASTRRLGGASSSSGPPPPIVVVPTERLMDAVYAPVRVLGAGAFGEALLVHDTRSCEQLVVKRLKGAAGSDAERQTMCNEVAILTAVRHPHVVALRHAWFEPSGHRLHMAMEFLGGGDLQALHEAMFPLPEAAVRSYISQMVLALRAVHRRHVIHRDAKLSNFFLSSDRRTCKLGDFGVSKAVSGSNEFAQTRAGTVVHFSPEIAMGDPYTNRCDVWSLGVALVFLLSNAPLFPAPTTDEYIKALMVKGIPQVRTVAHASFSDALCNLAQSMLVRRPERRPSTEALLLHPVIAETLALRPWSHDAGGGGGGGGLGSGGHPSAGAIECLTHARPAMAINVRAQPSLEAECVGRLTHGQVIVARGRLLDARGAEWLRLIAPMEGFCVASWEGKVIFAPLDDGDAEVHAGGGGTKKGGGGGGGGGLVAGAAARNAAATNLASPVRARAVPASVLMRPPTPRGSPVRGVSPVAAAPRSPAPRARSPIPHSRATPLREPVRSHIDPAQLSRASNPRPASPLRCVPSSSSSSSNNKAVTPAPSPPSRSSPMRLKG